MSCREKDFWMKIGISACSNGHKEEWAGQVDELVCILKDLGVEPVLVEHIMARKDTYSGTDKERAADLMRLYEDESIDAICDISGGDLANGVLKYLDFDVIGNSNKTFWGYSDLTTVINAIYTMTGKPSVLYQIKNLVYCKTDVQRKRIEAYLNGSETELFDINYDFLQGDSMEGIVVGGNLRCFTKLAGTRFWPDMTGKILLLESLYGDSGHIATMITQLEQMGVFDQVAGVLLGTFTHHEKEGFEYSIYDLLKMHISEDLPVAQTREIGHGNDSKAIIIGKKMRF